ncbi:tRNA threonylcarbamoyladenosine biosynthesis protein TsaB [Adhaeretor mobilis]|uniref:N(6)-L-threonylcarbamoyladenine synthase n=2 Tax=Adhaeretor mobilis TaxID=1930276 RepID=A0A517MV52_9BACT|nr:tRNA threonylcarbamoyladenosine biosynthesis protein TsaB [Adhaeretor mobilis]
MKLLALETSGKTGSVALLEGDDERAVLSAEIRLPEEIRSAQSLIPAIKHVLAEQDWIPAELGLICVATGPGSFTGLRVGVTAAKTLAYALRTPLVSVNTLAALAAGVEEPYQRLWCVLDAQRRELFTAHFQSRDSLAGQAEATADLLTTDAFLERLVPDDWVCGQPIEKLQGRLPEGVTTCESAQNTPQAAAVGMLGYELFLEQRTVDPLQLVPSYGRRSAAEEKADS